MGKLILDILIVNVMLGVALLAFASPYDAEYATAETLDATGDRDGHTPAAP